MFYISVGGCITYYIFKLSLEDYIGLECTYNYLLYIYNYHILLSAYITWNRLYRYEATVIQKV